jgi:hypothetical protein
LRQHFGAQQQLGSGAQQATSAAQQLGSGAQHEGSQPPQQPRRWNASACEADRKNRPANNTAVNTMRDFMDGTPKQKLWGFTFSFAGSDQCL